MDHGRQARDQMDAALLPEVPQQRGPASASRARLRSRQLHAHAGPATGDCALVADHTAGEADQDRREDGPPRPLCHGPDGRGCRVGTDVRTDPCAHHPAAGTACAGMTRAVVGAGRMIPGDLCPDDQEYSPEHCETAVGAGPGSERSAPPTRIDHRIAMKSPNGYRIGQNRRSSGECRLGIILKDQIGHDRLHSLVKVLLIVDLALKNHNLKE